MARRGRGEHGREEWLGCAFAEEPREAEADAAPSDRVRRSERISMIDDGKMEANEPASTIAARPASRSAAAAPRMERAVPCTYDATGTTTSTTAARKSSSSTAPTADRGGVLALALAAKPDLEGDLLPLRAWAA